MLLLAALLLLPSAARSEGSHLEQGRAAYSSGDLATALVQLRLALREARSEGDDTTEASCMAELGRVHADLGRHAEAIRWFEDALEIDRRLGKPAAVGGDRLALGREQAALGRLALARRHIEAAFESYQEASEPLGAADALVTLALVESDDRQLDRALELLVVAEGLYRSADHAEGLGDTLTNKGVVLGRLGRYGAAIEAHRQAIEAFDRVQQGGGRGAALHNLGNLHAVLGDYEQATQLYRQSRSLAEGPEERLAADQALGNILLAAGQLDEAEDAYERARESAGPRDLAGILLNLGALQELRGDSPQAKSLFEQAARSAEELGDEPTQVAALLGLGSIQLETGRADEAFATYKRCGALATRLGIADLEWRAWHGMGRASRARGHDGLTPLRSAVSVLEASRRSLEGLDPWALRFFVEDRRAVYEDLIDALLASGDGASALLYTERLQVAELGVSGGQVDATEARYLALAGREAELQEAIAQAQRSPEGRRDEERIEALRQELAETRVTFSAYVDGLRTSYPDFDRLVRVDPSDIESYQRDLGEDEVVLQPIVLPDRIAILVFSSGPLLFREVPVDRAELEGRIGRVLRTMRTRRLSNPERLNEHLDALGTWLWEPVADQLEGKKRVMVAASGPLRYVPFQLLRRGERYLVQDLDVVNVTNVGSLKRREGETLRLRRDGLLALGNPDGTLPAADREVDSLGALFPGAITLHGADASLSRLSELSAGRSVVHLATHGVLDSQAPERSYIVLAGPADSPRQGRLGYLEIPGLYEPLRDTQLVVLSACETAVPLAAQGDAVQGAGLEIAGLANQFRRAGVPRLLASLWQVSDESTAALMLRFYEALGEGRSPAAALATAQRALITHPEFSHPFYWAPFILIGSPR